LGKLLQSHFGNSEVQRLRDAGAAALQGANEN